MEVQVGRLAPAGWRSASEGGASGVGEVSTTSQTSIGWVYGAVGLVVAGGVFQAGVLFGLGLLLGGLLGLAWVWSRFCLQNVTVERRFSQSRAFWGEEIEVYSAFTNDKVLPVPWLNVEDEFPGPLPITSEDVSYMHKPRRQVLGTSISLNWYQRVTRQHVVKCSVRGEHEFGPIQIQSGDIFGFFRRTGTIATPQTLIVYPRYVPVERLGMPARQAFGDFKAVQHLATDPLRLRGVREYAYGDSPRYVHWKATARRGVMQTKLFEPAATPQLLIFCNQETRARIWEGIDREALELTITVAASIANHALEEGYMVGLQVNAFAPSSDRQVKLLPSRAPDQLTRILENLALIRDWSGLSMEDLLDTERRTMPRGVTVVMVTSLVSSEMLDVLLALRKAGHPVTLVEVVVAGSPGERAGGSTGALEAQGITYYRVQTVGKAADVEEISLSAG
jgi:uncharacterized protein (DUF58 family)